ncbi:PilN domain-containing protein [Legionella jordanis]|uniref:PilN domain-containing protein n=1 Tax=Legionella jordanis TaxID=456 RepID=UPI0014745EA1|nr:PilN domain-containing protein [Legionella jordanis]
MLSSISLIGFFKSYYSFAITRQLKRNAQLESEIKQCELKLKGNQEVYQKHASVMRFFERIKQFRRHCILAVHLLEELCTILPQQVRLKKISGKNQLILLQGQTKSQHELGILIRLMEKNHWLSQPRLLEMRKMEFHGKNVAQFKLSLMLKADAIG